MHLLQLYFNHCYSLFEQQRSPECGNYFLTVADRFTVRLEFSQQSLVPPILRSLAHLECAPIEKPDFTICIWDSSSSPEFAPPYPSFTREVFSDILRNEPIQVFCNRDPMSLSIFDGERNIGLFWIDDINNLPWYEKTRPLLDLIRCYAGRHGLRFVHASCVGSDNAGALIVGGSGAGKSTTALSFLSSTLNYVGDDLCLVGAEGANVHAYSLYSCGKLARFDVLPHLEEHISNPERDSSEKAVIFVNERFPKKIAKSVPVKAILLSSVGDDDESTLSHVPPEVSVRTLVQSTSEALSEMTTEEFFGLYRICAKVPCFTLKCGRDLQALHSRLIELLNELCQASV